MKAEELTSLLSSLLMRRTSDNQPTIVNLIGDATVFRPCSTPGAASSTVSWDALVSRQHWAPVGRFSRVLEPMFGNSAMLRGGDGWAGAVLPYLTVFACDWAATLAAQMGAELSCSVRRRCVDDRFRQDYRACLRDDSRAVQVTRQTRDALIRVVKSPPRWRLRPIPPAMLRLEPEGQTTRVIWLARDGKELGRETLQQLASRIGSEPQVTALLREADELHGRQAEHGERGDRKLEAVCPALAEAVRRAREHPRLVGYRMCTGSVRGLPAEVYVFAGPGPDAHRYVCAQLVARRAHEEFVLENRGGQHFYFPPVQLQAMIELIPTDPPWHVPLPMVRIPPSQPRWAHPYTGSLHADRFAAADLLPNGAQEAMVEISDDARRLLPQLARHANSSPVTGCMCLGGQDAQTAETTMQIRLAEKAGREPDLFGLVRGLWDVIRVGLTHGHQNNGNTPIAELSSAQMPYPIPAAALAGTKLAARTFPYNRSGSPL